MNKVHYRHFIKLNNRKKYHRVSSLTHAGYDYIRPDITKLLHCKNWCNRNLKEGSWISISGRFYFAYKKDAILFALHLC